MAGTTGAFLVLLLCASHAAATGCGVQEAGDIGTASEEGLVGEREFPWVVSLQSSRHEHLAFGSILSEFWILSVASAFQHRKDAVAIVGIARMNASEVSHEEIPVTTIILHELFDNKTMANNVALLRTDTAMQLSGLVQPICFLGRKPYLPLASRNCWVAGWNPTLATGEQMTMSILRKISVQDINLCPPNKVQKIGCGSHVEQETDTVCLGEPGNPLMCQLKGLDLWVLKGMVTPGGERCPGLFLFVRVEDYSDWITSRTQTDSLLPLGLFHHFRHRPRQHGPEGTPPWAPVTVPGAPSPGRANASLGGREPSPPGTRGAPRGAARAGGGGAAQAGGGGGAEGEEGEREEGEREEGEREEEQQEEEPYSDYYSEPDEAEAEAEETEAEHGLSVAGQDGLPRARDTPLLLCAALVCLWNGGGSGS